MSNQTASIKTLPAGKLDPVAFVYICGEVENDETGAMMAEVEYDVYDQAAFDALVIPDRATCSCCGHGLKYICVFKHSDSGQIFFVGRDCAAKIERLKVFSMVAGGEEMGLALLERAACSKREKDFLTAHPEAAEAVTWAKTGINTVAKDIMEKIRRYGAPTDKQIEFLLKLHVDDTTRRATATATAPTGRVKVKGTVLSAKLVDSGFGENKRANLLVDIGGGVKVYGNGGSACIKLNPMGVDELTVAKGDEIEFTATFNPSDKDNLFGFFKRPVKVTIKKP